MLSQKPWRAEAVIQLVAGVFACLCLGMVIAGLLRQAGILAFKSDDSFASLLLATLSFQGAAWILIFVFLKRHDVSLAAAIGWRADNLKRSLLTAVGALVLILLIAWPLQLACVTLLARLGVPPENERAVDLIVHAQTPWLRIYLAFFAVVLAPVAEEFVFRGILYPFVKQLGSPRTAFLGLSAIFAEIHFDAGTLLPLFVFALIQTWLYERTDNLLAPITSHALFNAVNLLVLYLIPWMNLHSSHA